jgi:ribonuclease BN (tRNA processing enzyme)
MEIIILGSGTTVPHPQRASPSVAVFIDEQFLLLDIGPGTVRQLAHAGLTHEDIDYIAISHFHPDHTADPSHLCHTAPPCAQKEKTFYHYRPEGVQ